MEYLTGILFKISDTLESTQGIDGVYLGLSEFDKVKNQTGKLNTFIQVRGGTGDDVNEAELLNTKETVNVGVRYTCDGASDGAALHAKLFDINKIVFGALKKIDFTSVSGFQSRTFTWQYFIFYSGRTIEIDYAINFNLIQEE